MSFPESKHEQSQLQKATAFHALHQGDEAFIIPNPWDTGTAQLLSQLGFKALATTSAGVAFFQGKRDNTLGRDAILSNAADIINSTPLPVSADLENGFGDAPDMIQHLVDVDGPMLQGTVIGKGIHAIDQAANAVGFGAYQLGQLAVLIVAIGLQQLRRAANAG